MTKFLLDQNLSPKTLQFIRELGWEAIDLRELGKGHLADEAVYELATAEGRVLITYDLDFSRRFMADQRLPGLILLRVHPQTIENLHLVLRNFLNRIKPNDLIGAIATLETRRYRLRKIHR